MLQLLLLYFLTFGTVGILCDETQANVESLPGHLKPFGAFGKSLTVDGYDGFPSPKHFHHSFVKVRRPLKMRGAAKTFPSSSRWDDDYFLGLDIGRKSNAFIHVETKKKENREQHVDYLHFHEFVKIYNKTEHYMVQGVPAFLKGDVSIPGSLQCKQIVEKLADVIMWFSSGGTKSVVHTDGVDNLNCLIRGEKTFVLVDPKYAEYVHLDRSNGTYSTLDVDSVDFKKYPKMHRVPEFYHVKMKAGDCLFIPFEWIHQVRSFHRNIAVNFWWDSRWVSYTPEMWEKDCKKQFEPSWTMKEVLPLGMEALNLRGTMRQLIDASKFPLDPESFILAMNPQADDLEKQIGIGFKMQLNQVFLIGDKDKDMLLTSDDYKLWTSDDVRRMDIYVQRYERILNAAEEQLREQEEQVGDNQELPPEFRGLREEL